MCKRLITSIAALVAVVALLVPVASAHHGWAGNTEDIALSGTVESPVSLAAPHASMRVRDAEGQIWDITLAPPVRTERAGLRPDTIPVGSEVTIVGQRNRDPDRLEIKTEQVRWNDRTFDIYPGRRNSEG